MVARGDPDAVPVGDFHLPNIVAWAPGGRAAGKPMSGCWSSSPRTGGSEGRVVRLLERYAGRAPAYGPRFAPRDFRRF